MNRVMAIDWSGDASSATARRKIWLAEARGGRLVRLESGRDRSELVAHLIQDAAAEPDVVVGFDFAFSFPQWYVEKLNATSIEGLWNLVAVQGEEWLANCPDPFWGRCEKRKLNLPQHFRVTENQASESPNANPKSVFQLLGAGTVGVGSIRGIPYLAKLRKEGFSIWPFHEVQTPLVIEIYPRLLTGRVNRNNCSARQAYLAQKCPEVDSTLVRKAASSEDAFDAAVSAIVMDRHLTELKALSATTDPTELLEGRIWWPQEIS